MGKPTEKMVYALKKLGYKDEQISLMEYEAASQIIGKSKESQNPQIEKVYPQEKQAYQKPAYNPSSQYVNYSKDIFLELRKMMHVELAKTPNLIDDKVIMQLSINLVKQAIKEFE
jgi:hypothetical protein